MITNKPTALTQKDDLLKLRNDVFTKLPTGYVTMQALQGRATAKCKSQYGECSSVFDAPFDIKYHHADEVSDCIPWTNKILEYVSLFVILASVVTLCVESLPQYRLNQTDGTKLSTKGTPLFF
eukprot:gene29399-13877_t